MSTDIAVIKKTGDKGDRDLDFTQVAKRRGVSIQITQGFAGVIGMRKIDEPGFITLTREEAYKSIAILEDWLVRTK